jgi:glyoxylase-like metal-dependent hydrolase (beta-lactamase superfamily II)
MRDMPTVEQPLVYLHETAPEFGHSLEIAKGLVWLRLPLPYVLNHVNSWLLDDGDGWTIIDTGSDTEKNRAIWDDVIATRLGDKPVKRLVCTHGHPDHVGLAGWLCDKLDIRLHMTYSEWLAPQLWREQGLKPMAEAEKRGFLRNGISERGVAKMMQAREAAPFRNYPLPMSVACIRDGDAVEMGGRTWKVLVNGGHAEEHASFYTSKGRILIAGDQILSKISPVVGVFTSQPTGNPLRDYLASLKRLSKLPADTLVLPSHGLPFHGLHERIGQLEAHHAKRLAELLTFMPTKAAAAKNGAELARQLFAQGRAYREQGLRTVCPHLTGELLGHARPTPISAASRIVAPNCRPELSHWHWPACHCRRWFERVAIRFARGPAGSRDLVRRMPSAAWGKA